MVSNAALIAIVGFLSRHHLVSTEDLSPDEIQQLYKKQQIIPDIFPKEAPKNILKCRYGDLEIDLGSNLTLIQSLNKPDSCEWPAKEGAYYSLMLLGLDSPTHKYCYEREYNHWLVGNIPESNIAEGDTLAEYQGGEIAYEPGTHRVVFIVYKQPDKIVFNETRLAETSDFWTRVLFTHEGFSRKHRLGKAYASSFFYIRFQNEMNDW